MSVEYVLFDIEELNRLKHGLLSSQLSTLSSLQHLQNYKKFRNEEINLKIKLKSLLEQSQNEIQVLKKLLPETQFKPHKSHLLDHMNSLQSQNSQLSSSFQQNPPRQKSSLESEIDAIKAKLALLQ